MFQKLRSLFKILIYSFLYYTGTLHLLFCLYIKRGENFPVLIINHHGFCKDLNPVFENHPVMMIKIGDFEKEILFLKKYFEIVSLDDVPDILSGNRKISRPAAVITVDDGYKNNYDILFPAIRKLGIPVTIFLTTGLIGTNCRTWIDYLSDLLLSSTKNILKMNDLLGGGTISIKNFEDKKAAYIELRGRLKDMQIAKRNDCLSYLETELGRIEYQERVMMNWDEVRRMLKGGVAFGTHSVTHPILTSLPLEQAKQEIVQSKNTLERELQTEVKHFAFPNGRLEDFNEDLRKFCQTSQFYTISTCSFGCNWNADDVWSLRRIGPCLPISVFAVDVFRAISAKVDE